MSAKFQKKSQRAGNSVLCGKDLKWIPQYISWYTDFPYEFLIGEKNMGIWYCKKKPGVRQTVVKSRTPLQRNCFSFAVWGKQSDYRGVSSCWHQNSCGLNIDVQREIPQEK